MVDVTGGNYWPLGIHAEPLAHCLVYCAICYAPVLRPEAHVANTVFHTAELRHCARDAIKVQQPRTTTDNIVTEYVKGFALRLSVCTANPVNKAGVVERQVCVSVSAYLLTQRCELRVPCVRSVRHSDVCTSDASCLLKLRPIGLIEA